MNLSSILNPIWLYLPAYFANATPVALGGGPPLDGGEKWLDGKPFLGGHKTIRGCLVGVTAGVLIGTLQGRSLIGLIQGVGAILGDLISSFIKRRVDVVPGASFPFLDQLDFIVTAIILSQPYTKASLQEILVIIILTIPIHYLSNYISWLLKMKDNPW